MTAPSRPSIGIRLRIAWRLLLSLRRHDFRAARTFMRLEFPDDGPLGRLARFTKWASRQVFVRIPHAMQRARFAESVSTTPFWLKDGNPLENHPWASRPSSELPPTADTVVIGCGLAGFAVAYHWGRYAPEDRCLIVLEMGDAASGSAGRNEGLVVMGRYYHMVVHSVLPYLREVRPDLTPPQREQLARQFAARYAAACYRNGDLVEQTIRDEGLECDYAREGWVQARGPDDQASLADSVRMALDSGYTDWSSITPEEVKRRCGMLVRHNAGFSMAAASFHPAKWCWGLLDRALGSGTVELFSRTRVAGVDDAGERYIVSTDRGEIRARHIVLCTESYTPLLMPQFHDVIRPTQTQAASGPGGPPGMKPHVGISGMRAFFGRHGDETMVGSDATRVPDREAGRNQPSRFLTHFLCAELQDAYGPSDYTITHEWSGTVTYTPDEYPVVGVFDGKRQYILGGMAGSGTAVSFNGGRCLVNRILGRTAETDDYPAAYFSPQRLLNPSRHRWPDQV